MDVGTAKGPHALGAGPLERQRPVCHPALGPDDVRVYRSNSHSANFLECIRTRQRTIGHAEAAHRAMSVMLLGGIAERLKRPLKWDPKRERFVGDAEADRMLSVTMRPPWRL